VTPLELTAAFAMFPNGGMAVRPRGITRVLDADGGVAYDNPAQADRVLSEDVAFQMVSMLEDVVDRGTATPARTTYGVRFPVAGKTGTTDDFKDAWFVGFTSSTVVGVWVGRDQPATIGREAYGARYANWHVEWYYKLPAQKWIVWRPQSGEPFWADAIDPKTVTGFEAHAIVEVGPGFTTESADVFDAQAVITDVKPFVAARP